MVDNGFNTEWEQEINLYLDNELSQAGRERVEKHLDRSEASSRYYRIVQREDQLLSGRMRHELNSSFKADNFTNAVMDSLPGNPANPFVQKIKHGWEQVLAYFYADGSRRLALACSIVVCVVGILASMQFSTPDEHNFINIKQNGVYSRAMLPGLFLVRDSQGQFIELPDTSMVLAPQGTLFSIENYQEGSAETSVGTERRLSLKTGELFIDVHPEKEGFSVVCTNAKATVFGTQFYIATTPGPKKETIIAVREGSVMVEKQGRNQRGSTVVSPGQMVKVLSERDNVILRAPEPMTSEISIRLDEFHRLRSDRSSQRIQAQKTPFEESFGQTDSSGLQELPQWNQSNF